MPDLELQVNRLEGDVAELRDDVSHVKEKVAGHEIRFSNGRKIMAELKGEVEKLKPKAPDWLKLLLAGLSIVGVMMGAQLWLTDKFSERPTEKKMNQRIAPVEEAQEETSKEIREMRDEQIEQRQIIKGIEKTQYSQDDKLDDILTRLPRRRGR